MPRVESQMDSALPPERILAALTDFSERRPGIWPGLWAGAFKVYDVGDTWALVREGNKTPRVWAKERYDWSKPNVVRWEVVESNFCAPGDFVEVRLEPRNGGTRIHITWRRTGTKLGYRMMVGLIALTRLAPVKSSMKAGLARVATGAAGGNGPSPAA